MKRRFNAIESLIALFILGGVVFTNTYLVSVANAYDCSSFASVQITTDKPAYIGGETIDGDIIFTNTYTRHIVFKYTLNMYEDSALKFTLTRNGSLAPGVHRYRLSQFYDSLDIPAGTPDGTRTFTVSVIPYEAPDCEWVDTAAATIGESSTIPPFRSSATFPMIAGIHYGSPHNYDDPAFQRELAKRDLIVLGIYMGSNKGGTTPAQALAEIRALNPDISIGNYTIMTGVSRNDASEKIFQDKLNSEIGPNGIGDWWAYDENGVKTDWANGTYGMFDVNITSNVTPDANGERWPGWLAKTHYEQLIKGADYDFWFFDNNFWEPHSDADWDRDGKNDNRSDATVRDSWRAAQRAYYDKARALAPTAGFFYVANVDGDLSGEVYPQEATPFNEYKNAFEGAFFEHIMGQDWSMETWSTWDHMQQRYAETLSHLLEPKVAIFEVVGAKDDYQFFRYAFTSALMNNGHFAYSTDPDYMSYELPPWFDEYDLAGTATTKWLGMAIDAPPTSAWQNGVYQRRFENGMAIVNPKGNGTQTVTVEPGYKRIAGTQAPTVNNGQPAGDITLNERDGILLIRY